MPPQHHLWPGGNQVNWLIGSEQVVHAQYAHCSLLDYTVGSTQFFDTENWLKVANLPPFTVLCLGLGLNLLYEVFCLLLLPELLKSMLVKMCSSDSFVKVQILF